MDLTTDERIKKEKRRIAKLYKDLPCDRLKIMRTLIDRAAYMTVSLEDMERQINEDGLLVEMPQGDYAISRAHPLLQSYNAMIKNFNATVKLLGEGLPPAQAEQAGQALMNFITKPNKAAVK